MDARKAIVAAGIVTAAALMSPAAEAQQGRVYLGGSFGQSEVQGDFCEGATTCDEKDSAWRIFGGYEFNRNFALEFGYANLGEATASGNVPPFTNVNARFETTAFDLTAVGILPLNNQFSVFGRIGLYRAETDLTGSATLGSVVIPVSEGESNMDLTFAVGARFDITRNFSIRAEWQRYQDVGGGDTGEADVDVMSIGLMYRF